MIDPKLMAQLEKRVERHKAVEEELSKPETSKSPKLMRDLGRELSMLEPLVAVHRRADAMLVEVGNLRQEAREGDAETAELAHEMLAEREETLALLNEEIRDALVPPDPYDDSNIMMEIRAGAGGEEAGLFAAELFRMYCRYAELKRFKVALVNMNETGIGGMKEAIFTVQGKGAYSLLKFEGGVHRVQRVPATESSGRIHTSTVTVAVMPEAEEVDVDLREEDIRVETYHASGAGGQHVNTTDSAVRMIHEPTGLVVTCQDERSQHKNRAKAMQVLRTRLLELEIAKADAERQAERRSMVGAGSRSEKIRTYNFPQDRLTDHRIQMTMHNLERIMQGELDDMIVVLQREERLRRSETV